jgi:hypothetical protein
MLWAGTVDHYGRALSPSFRFVAAIQLEGIIFNQANVCGPLLPPKTCALPSQVHQEEKSCKHGNSKLNASRAQKGASNNIMALQNDGVLRKEEGEGKK